MPYYDSYWDTHQPTKMGHQQRRALVLHNRRYYRLNDRHAFAALGR